MSVVAVISAPGAIMSGFMILGLMVLVTIDLVRSGKNLKNIAVNLPARIRLTKDREGKIELEIHNIDKQLKSLRLGLPTGRAARRN